MRMLAEVAQPDILKFAGAFVLGWLLAKIGSRLARRRVAKRDPRDDRIRQQTAELRIAQSNAQKSAEALEAASDELREARQDIEKRDSVITRQQSEIAALNKDLRDAVAKTRELRTELTDRATENRKSEARLREVETELSVAHASHDLIATGVLDYEAVTDLEDETEGHAPAQLEKTSREA